MNNLQKRIFTSIILVTILLSCLFISSITWLILLLIVSAISLYEFFFLIKKIYKDIFVKLIFWLISAYYLALFFNSALDKFGVSSPKELSGDKEKEFYDYVDKNWDAKEETD